MQRRALMGLLLASEPRPPTLLFFSIFSSIFIFQTLYFLPFFKSIFSPSVTHSCSPSFALFRTLGTPPYPRCAHSFCMYAQLLWTDLVLCLRYIEAGASALGVSEDNAYPWGGEPQSSKELLRIIMIFFLLKNIDSTAGETTWLYISLLWRNF